MPLSDWRDGLDHLDAADARRDLRPRLPARQHRGRRGLRLVLRQRRRPRGADPHADHRRRGREAVGVPLQGYPRAGGRTRTSTGRAASRAASPTAWVPESKPIRFTEIGCPAVDRGTNQPNVFFDPKSSESFLPYFSRGWRDDAMQRRFIEAALGYWAEPANNPTSSVYSGRMIAHRRDRGLDLGRAAVSGIPGAERRLDRCRQLAARALAERPARLGLAREPGARALPSRRDARRPDRRLGARRGGHGYLITALESPRASIAPLARHFGFDAVESEGVIRFQLRDRRPVATFALDDSRSASERTAR